MKTRLVVRVSRNRGTSSHWFPVTSSCMSSPGSVCQDSPVCSVLAVQMPFKVVIGFIGWYGHVSRMLVPLASDSCDARSRNSGPTSAEVSLVQFSFEGQVGGAAVLQSMVHPA